MAERAMVRTVRKVIELLPGNAEQPTWLNSVYDWATEKLQNISRRDDDARHRELLRLMNLLKSDPDQGLRFALPFGGEAHRGLSPPSNRLGARDVNYRLGGQGGGAPADYWDVSADMQFRLMQQYRELAAREIAIGRHRRAAYIYAHLLGDLKSAAATLADGGHYRDAAVLYEEKLNRPELAAECLRRGGLRLEAIAIYERLEKHEIVGDLYAELERPDEASGAWRRAVAAHQQASDVLAAAKLLEAKLEAADEAFRLLADAWPASSQAQSCLAEAFQTARRSRLHDLAARLVDDAAVRIGTGHAAPLADILADQASQYPDDAVRRLARERTQIVVSQRLSADIDDRETMRLVGALRKLAPNDRLLERDGHRFVGLRREARPVVKPKLSRGRLTVVDQVMLGMPCRAATSTHEAIFAAGVQEGELKVVRLGWSAPTVERPFGKSWRFSPELEQNAVLLMADPTGMNDAVIHVCGAPALPNGQLFRATDQFPKPLGIGSHRGISSATVGGLCCSNEHCTFINVEPPKFLEHTYHLLDSSRLSESSDLFEWPTDGFDLKTLEMPLPIAMVAGKLHVGIGASLCCHAAGKTTVHHLPQPAVQLVASAPGTRARLAVAMQRGGLLYWGDACGQSVPFASVACY